MDWPIIRKHASGERPPNLGDYEQARREFSWERARSQLAGLPRGEGVNIADEAVDRHVREGRGGQLALRCLARGGGQAEFAYSELAALSNRFANALETVGVQPGERVFTLLGRVPALYIAALGSWKHRAVLSPLFAAFGPEPIAARMAIAEPVVLVTGKRMFERKILPMLDRLPFLRFAIVVDEPGEGSVAEPLAATACRRIDFQELLDSASPVYRIGPTDPESLSTLHFTSGTTGPARYRRRWAD